jgi:hypothetical protein
MELNNYAAEPFEPCKKGPKNYSEAAKRYREGARIVDLAEDYGISRPGMYQRLKKEGISDFRDDRKKLDVAEAIDLYMQGVTMTNIAKRFRSGVSTVSMALKKHGVTTRHRAVMPDLEKISLVMPDAKKDSRAAFKEFQKDLGAESAGGHEGFSSYLNDDVADIEALLNL